MANYVRKTLGWTFSENDFTERIVELLSASPNGNPSLDLQEIDSLDMAVKESLKSLVYGDKRSAYRRRTEALDDALRDPKGESFVAELEAESSAREILNNIPRDWLPVVQSLYGLSGEEQKSVREVASKLGITEELLRQRLCRLRGSVRQRLRKKS